MKKILSSLPHKKLLISGLIALTVFIVGFYAMHKNEFYGDERLAAQPIMADESGVETDIDSDKDGLPDWKERLIGSDIYNKDSDGDGTIDGEEVREGRNPIKKGPDDKLSYLRDPNFATSSTDINGIKKEFFAKYLAEKGAEIKETTFRDLIKKNVNSDKFKPAYELVDLNVSSDNSDAAMRKYLNGFGAIIKKYTVRSHRTEEEILLEASKTKNAKMLKELQLPAISYKNFAKDLVALEVPSVAAKNHLLIVNGYDVMARGILEMQKMFSNPIESTAGYQAYMRYRFNVTTGYAALVSSVGDRKMTFTKDEAGYPFYWNTASQARSKGVIK